MRARVRMVGMAGALLTASLSACSSSGPPISTGTIRPRTTTSTTSDDEATATTRRPGGNSTPTTRRSATTRPAESVPPGGSGGGPASFDELEALLVVDVPDGFLQASDDVGDTGPSNLAKAARDEDEPGAEAALTAEGFVRGYQRLWTNDDDDGIVVFLYQFATQQGAAQDFDRLKVHLTEDVPDNSTSFPVAGIPGAATVEGSDDESAGAVVEFASGVFHVIVICDSDTPPGLRQRATAVALDQFDRLTRI